MAESGAQAVEQVLDNFDALAQTAKEQESALSTNTKKIEKSEGFLQFSNLAAELLYNRWRAFSGIIPLYTRFRGNRLTLHELSRPSPGLELPQLEKPGQALYHKPCRALIVKAGDGALVACTKLQLENKKAVDARNFANGFLVSTPVAHFE